MQTLQVYHRWDRRRGERRKFQVPFIQQKRLSRRRREPALVEAELFIADRRELEKGVQACNSTIRQIEREFFYWTLLTLSIAIGLVSPTSFDFGGLKITFDNVLTELFVLIYPGFCLTVAGRYRKQYAIRETIENQILIMRSEIGNYLARTPQDAVSVYGGVLRARAGLMAGFTRVVKFLSKYSTWLAGFGLGLIAYLLSIHSGFGWIIRHFTPKIGDAAATVYCVALFGVASLSAAVVFLGPIAATMERNWTKKYLREKNEKQVQSPLEGNSLDNN